MIASPKSFHVTPIESLLIQVRFRHIEGLLTRLFVVMIHLCMR